MANTSKLVLSKADIECLMFFPDGISVRAILGNPKDKDSVALLIEGDNLPADRIVELEQDIDDCGCLGGHKVKSRFVVSKDALSEDP